MKPLVIYHDNCADGFGAAFAAWLKLGDEAEYLPMQYGFDDVPDFKGREVYMVDFSWSKPLMEDLFLGAKRVVWLDHHKTAFEMWCGKYEKGLVWKNNQNYTPSAATKTCSRIVLDDSKSGALLAWEYFHPDTEAPMLVQHIDDRDRWQFKLEGSKELHAALSSYSPWSFEQWRSFINPRSLGGLPYAEGSTILRAQEQHVKQMAKHARKCKIWYTTRLNPYSNWKEFHGLAVNVSLHQSEVGHELANQSGTYGLVWYVAEDGRVRGSLRSNGDYDVSAIAKSLGGGGHRNAAGFETDIGTLMGWLK